MKLQSKILTLFSYLFHPLFVGVYAVFIYFFLGIPYFEYPIFYLTVIQVVILTILIPLTFYFLLLSLKKVDSLMLSQTVQRKIPLAIHIVLLAILVTKSITILDHPELFFYFLGSIVSGILALVAVFAKHKASLHMVGIASLTAFAIAISYHFQVRMVVVIVSLLIITGLTATSRLEMKAHTNTELVSGTLVGVIPQIIIAYFWL